jgi:hypothetical protein
MTPHTINVFGYKDFQWTGQNISHGHITVFIIDRVFCYGFIYSTTLSQLHITHQMYDKLKKNAEENDSGVSHGHISTFP